MIDPFLVVTYLGAFAIFSVLMSVEIYLSDTPLPTRADYRDAYALVRAWIADELEDDLMVVREYRAADVARIAAETVLMVGLAFRTAIHTISYAVAAPGREPEWVTIGFADPVGPRPAWHRATSVLATAALVGYFATHYPISMLDAGFGATTRTLIITWMVANALAAVCDPLTLIVRHTHKQLSLTITKSHT